MASDQASGQEAARSTLLRRRVGGSIDSNGGQNLDAGGKDSDSSRYGQESQRTGHERSEPARSFFFKIPSERVNATVFIDFLKELLAEYPKRKIFVIADQASPHIAKSVKAFVAGQKRLELFYLPTYSPDFNPDEGVWSHLKSQELKAHQATNKEELIKKTHEALKRMAKRPVLIRSFFKRCNIT